MGANPNNHKGRLFVAVVLSLSLLGLGCSPQLPSATEYVDRAKDRQDQGQLNAAIVELKNALRLQPDNTEARWLLGQIYLRTGSGAEAEKELHRAASLGVDRTKVAPLLAEALFQQGRFRDLLRDFAPAPDAKRNDRGKLEILRGDALRALKDYDLAVASYQAALEDVPNSVDALVGLASVAIARGDANEAERLLSLVGEEHAKYPNYLATKAALFFLESDEKRAEEQLRKLLAVHPENVAGQVELARLLLLRNELDEADQHLARAQKVFANHPEAVFLRGWIAAKQGDYQTAERRFALHRKLIKNDPRTLLMQASTAYHEGHLEQAGRYARKLLAIDANNPAALRLYGAIQLARGEPQKVVDAIGPKAENIGDAKLLALVAMAALKAGLPQESMAYLEESVAADPGFKPARDELLRQQLAVGETEQAIATLEQALRAQNDALPIAKQLFAQYLRAQDVDKAVALGERLVKRHPQEPLAYNLRGTAYWTNGQLLEARQDLWKALVLDPDYMAAALNLAQVSALITKGKGAKAAVDELKTADPDLLELRAEALLTGEHLDAAYRMTLDLLKRRPNYAPAHYLAARILAAKQEVEPLRRELQKTLDLNSQHVMARVMLAELAIADGRFDDAQKAIEILQAQNEDLPFIARLRGSMALRQGDFKTAISSFRQALEQSPEHRAILLKLARAYASAGDTESAVVTLEGWVKQYPDDAVVWRELTKGYWSLGRDTEARAALERAGALAANNARVLADLARLALAKAPDQALEFARRATELAPDDPSVREALGMVLLQQGKTREAFEALRSALTGDPREHAYRYALARALIEAGDKADAKTLLQPLVAADSDFVHKKEAKALLDSLAD